MKPKKGKAQPEPPPPVEPEEPEREEEEEEDDDDEEEVGEDEEDQEEPELEAEERPNTPESGSITPPALSPAESACSSSSSLLSIGPTIYSWRSNRPTTRRTQPLAEEAPEIEVENAVSSGGDPGPSRNLVVVEGSTATGKPGKNGPAKPGKDFPQKSGKDIPQKSGKDFPQRSGKDIPQKSGKDFPQRSGKDIPQKSGKDMPQKSGKDMPQKSGKDFPEKSGSGREDRNMPRLSANEPIAGTSASFYKKYAAAGKPDPDLRRPLSVDVGSSASNSSNLNIYGPGPKIFIKRLDTGKASSLLTIDIAGNSKSTLPKSSLPMDLGDSSSSLAQNQGKGTGSGKKFPPDLNVVPSTTLGKKPYQSSGNAVACSSTSMASSNNVKGMPLLSEEGLGPLDIGEYSNITAIMDGQSTLSFDEAGPSQKLAEFSLSEYPTIASCIKSYKQAESVVAENMDPLQHELESILSVVSNRYTEMKDQHNDLYSPLAQSLSSDPMSSFIDSEETEKVSAMPTSHVVFLRPAAPKRDLPQQPNIDESFATEGNSTEDATLQPESAKTQLRKKKVKGAGVGTKARKERKKAAARKRSPSTDLNGANDAPNQFWKVVDSYCRHIDVKDVQRLQALMDSTREIPEDLKTIPPLGKHFKGEKEAAREQTSSKDPIGPLTEKLVAAMVKEKVAMNINALSTPASTINGATFYGSASKSNEEQCLADKPGILRALASVTQPGGGPLEGRIRDCLIDQGLYDEDDDPMDDDDEVLAEIKKTQALLGKLHAYNRTTLERAMHNARIQLARQPLVQQLEKTDRGVFAVYQGIAALRQKKKSPNYDQNQAVAKALAARKRALEALETFDKKFQPLDVFGPHGGSKMPSCLSAKVAK